VETQTQKQNLLNQVAPVRVSRPPGFYKSGAIDGLAVLSAFLVGWVFKGFVVGTLGSVALLLSLAAFMTLAFLSTLFAEGFGRRSFIVILESIALLIFFTQEETRAFGMALGILLVFLFWGEFSAWQEIHNGFRLRFFRIARQNLSKLTTGIILAYLVIYYPYLSRENALVPRAALTGTFDWAGGIVQQFYRDINIKAPIREVAGKILEIRLNQEPSYRALTPPEREKFIREQADTLIANVGGSLGYAIEAQKTLEETTYDILTKTLNDLQGRFGSSFFVGWVVVIFLVVRSLGTIFYWCVSGVAFLAYEMLLAFNFVRIVSEPRSQEVIVY